MAASRPTRARVLAVLVFPVAFAVALILLGAFFLFLVYYAVSSIWGYENQGPQWQYAFVAAGEVIVGAWLAVSGFRVLRAAVRSGRSDIRR